MRPGLTMARDDSSYRTHPVHDFNWLRIRSGFDALAAELKHRVQQSTRPVVAVDGFLGVRWDLLAARLRAAVERVGLEADWLPTASCLLPPKQISELLQLHLTRDPVFGRLFRGDLSDLMDQERVAGLRGHALASWRPVILYGFGASTVADAAVRVYVDIPKDLAQSLATGGAITNVGAAGPEAFGAMYKRMYFVDWPMLNRIKRRLLPRLDLFVDGSDAEQPRFVEGAAMRRALSSLARQPFRVKPWFSPGPWGGQWMKERFGLPAQAVNYAWSFELVAPENGLLLGDGRSSLECSFDHLLWQETEAVLGVSVAARYGSYFPIRFDYLDTMGGGNLSCQVHPRLDYIQDEFGEPLTQDETYYVVTNRKGAQVYLGLREDTDLTRFQQAAESARDHGLPFEIDAYVNRLSARPHDLFLIPSGTVHCSGADNVVLEISATPYIYTFKIYDYLRPDLHGSLRLVQLERAFANVDATRRTRWVQDHLRATPVAVRRGKGWAEKRLAGSDDRLFFAIHRLEFNETVSDDTRGVFLALNLVEGDRCEVVTDGGSVELRSAESMIIPASVGPFSLRRRGSAPCKVVKAFVKV
jgi:mannose-6-phosphate isomerase class I